MLDFKKTHKFLITRYNKKLKELHKKNFNNLGIDIESLVTRIRFIRDYYILTEELTEGPQENLKVTSAAMAVAEYTKYKTCIQKYFTKEGRILDAIPKELTKEDVIAKYTEERKFHWDTFWKLVTVNIESWNDINVTI